ncbi:hypothetical protein H9L39_15605 [Fusarium oxysporum f. sp. albedinis]|nr:hypothetical protein H9L39_15605 [Fusarium oxysporum f. sp. albedinis]
MKKARTLDAQVKSPVQGVMTRDDCEDNDRFVRYNESGFQTVSVTYGRGMDKSTCTSQVNRFYRALGSKSHHVASLMNVPKKVL